MRAGPLTALAVLLAASVPRAAWADVQITVDKASQRMAVSVDGQPRYSWPVSTGLGGYDTPSGSYRPFRMERSHFSREWDDAPMPYALFFTNQGHAIHGTNHVRNLGRAASHGCVRLSVRNAATLFTLVKAQGMGSTRVVITGEGAPVAAREGRPARVVRAARRERDPFGADGAAMAYRPSARAPVAATYYGPTGRPLYAPVRGYGVPDDGIDGGW
jgi:hypothetical protein